MNPTDEAFPLNAEDTNGFINPGMDMRHYFAAKILQGLCANPNVTVLDDRVGVRIQNRNENQLAAWAFHIAEEAIKAGTCSTCDGNRRIGGPSFSQPDEGGVPCPDCTGKEAP